MRAHRARTLRGLAAALLCLGGASCSAAAASAAKPLRLTYHGGAVLHVTRPYLIFWDPPGERHHIPATSRAVLGDYLTDTARDSGLPDDIYGVLRQYTDGAGFADSRELFSSRDVRVDAHPYPRRPRAGPCAAAAAGYAHCLTDAELQDELSRYTAAHRLPTAWEVTGRRGNLLTVGSPAPVYVLVTPADVDLCYEDGGPQCADRSFCSYHSSYFTGRSGRRMILYVVLSFVQWRVHPDKGCQGDGHGSDYETPAGPGHGDRAYQLVSDAAHELAETITDPLGDGWFASEDYASEVADVCSYTGPADPPLFEDPHAWGPDLGGTVDDGHHHGQGTLFNQLIDGSEYYTQNVWSNGENDCRGWVDPPRPGSFNAAIAPAAPLAGQPTPLFAYAASARSISSATWSFGDGSRDAFARYPRLRPVRHTFRRAGAYTVTLTLVDGDGYELVVTSRVQVAAPHRRLP